MRKLWLLACVLLGFMHSNPFFAGIFQRSSSTHQDDLFDVFGRTPVKHPCRVIPLDVHVHVLDLLISRD